MPFISDLQRPSSADYNGDALEARLARLSLLEACSLLDTLLATPQRTESTTNTTSPQSSRPRPVGLPTTLPAYLSKKREWGEIAAILDEMLSLYEETDCSSTEEADDEAGTSSLAKAGALNDSTTKDGKDDDIDVWHGQSQERKKISTIAKRGDVDDWRTSESAAVTPVIFAGPPSKSAIQRVETWLTAVPPGELRSTPSPKPRLTTSSNTRAPTETIRRLVAVRQELELAPYTPKPAQDPEDLCSDETLTTAVLWAELLERMHRLKQSTIATAHPTTTTRTTHRMDSRESQRSPHTPNSRTTTNMATSEPQRSPYTPNTPTTGNMGTPESQRSPHTPNYRVFPPRQQQDREMGYTSHNLGSKDLSPETLAHPARQNSGRYQHQLQGPEYSSYNASQLGSAGSYNGSYNGSPGSAGAMGPYTGGGGYSGSPGSTAAMGPYSDNSPFSGGPGSYNGTPGSYNGTPGSYNGTPGSYNGTPGSMGVMGSYQRPNNSSSNYLGSPGSMGPPDSSPFQRGSPAHSSNSSRLRSDPNQSPGNSPFGHTPPSIRNGAFETPYRSPGNTPQSTGNGTPRSTDNVGFGTPDTGPSQRSSDSSATLANPLFAPTRLPQANNNPSITNLPYPDINYGSGQPAYHDLRRRPGPAGQPDDRYYFHPMLNAWLPLPTEAAEAAQEAEKDALGTREVLKDKMQRLKDKLTRRRRVRKEDISRPVVRDD